MLILMSSPVQISLLVVIIVSILGSAFFSSCEIAYSSVSSIRLKKMAEQGNAQAKASLKIVDNYSKMLSTILIGNNLVNIFISSLATLLCLDYFGPQYGDLIAIVGTTIFVLIFGEIIPKTFAKKYALGFSLHYTKPITFINYLFFPITWLVTKLIDKISVIWTPKEHTPTATDEELITIAEELEEEGIIDEDDAELIISAIDFCDVTAHEIMIPRVDVYAIDIDDDQEAIIAEGQIFKYSRVPVYEDTIDNIVGIINTTSLMKDLLNGETINLKEMLQEPFYVHKTKPISSILTEFKEQHNRIAIVVDEFGGVMGILTLEDIIEELVGDIFDETDEVVEDYRELAPNVYEVDGDMNIYDFFELVDYDDKDFESEYTTVGGWCTDILEKFPEVGDHFDFANFKVTVTAADKMRVGMVRVEVFEEDSEDE